MSSPFTDKQPRIWTIKIENLDTKRKKEIDSVDLTQDTKNEIRLQNRTK